MASSPTEGRASVVRDRNDIARELLALASTSQKVFSFLEGGAVLFESRLVQVDPEADCILLEPLSGEHASQSLLAQPRCIFSATHDGWRTEFVTGSPRLDQGAIRLAFPEVLTRWRRRHERADVSPGIPLQCVADSEGVMPFEGLVVDIGAEGLGFLIHSETIMLEPGTVLRSCIIDVPGRPPCKADLEVCYSQPVILGDGSHSLRSGCRFVDPTGAVSDLIRYCAEARASEQAARTSEETGKQDLI